MRLILLPRDEQELSRYILPRSPLITSWSQTFLSELRDQRRDAPPRRRGRALMTT
jgi:hypothetical protein